MKSKPVELVKPNPEVADMDLSFEETRRKRIRIDGDDSRIVELNLSDMGIFERLDESENKIQNLENKYHEAVESLQELSSEDEKFDYMIDTISKLDEELKNIFIYIFNTPTIKHCVPDGTMFDVYNGVPRYEIILAKFLPLYTNNYNREMKKLDKNVAKLTAKYTDV